MNCPFSLDPCSQILSLKRQGSFDWNQEELQIPWFIANLCATMINWGSGRSGQRLLRGLGRDHYFFELKRKMRQNKPFFLCIWNKKTSKANQTSSSQCCKSICFLKAKGWGPLSGCLYAPSVWSGMINKMFNSFRTDKSTFFPIDLRCIMHVLACV